jgi:hypothetical protein
MSIFSAVSDFIGGSVATDIKELILAYKPPGLTAIQQQEYTQRQEELGAKLQELMVRKAKEAGDIANATLSLELADIQDARKTHALSKVPAWIAGATTIMIIAIYAALIFAKIPPENRELLIQLNGTVQTVWFGAVAYFIGTTRSSATKGAAQNEALIAQAGVKQ